MTFRSIVIPFTTTVLNLLSVGAAYAVLVLIFQQGDLRSLLGLHVDRRRYLLAATIPARDPVECSRTTPGCALQPCARWGRVPDFRAPMVADALLYAHGGSWSPD